MFDINYSCNPETLDSYIEAVKEEVKNLLPGKEVSFTSRQVRKNNGVILNGLTVSVDNLVACPTIYPEEQFNAGIPAALTAKKAVEAVNQSIGGVQPEKENIYPRLVNALYNKQEILAERIPVGRELDLAEKLYVRVDNFGIPGWIQVTPALLDIMGTTREEAFTIAEKNLEKEAEKAVIKPLGSIIGEMMQEMDGCGICDAPEVDGTMSMYVVTNASRYYGATLILSETLRKRIRDVVGGDYYVLPSSVHEVIVVPMTDSVDVNELITMVREVNRSQVAQEDLLSDNVYVYDKDGFSIARPSASSLSA